MTVPDDEKATPAPQGRRTQEGIRQEDAHLKVSPASVSSLSGRYKDDPELSAICEQIYRNRDAERPH